MFRVATLVETPLIGRAGAAEDAAFELVEATTPEGTTGLEHAVATTTAAASSSSEGTVRSVMLIMGFTTLLRYALFELPPGGCTVCASGGVHQ